MEGKLKLLDGLGVGLDLEEDKLELRPKVPKPKPKPLISEELLRTRNESGYDSWASGQRSRTISPDFLNAETWVCSKSENHDGEGDHDPFKTDDSSKKSAYDLGQDPMAIVDFEDSSPTLFAKLDAVPDFSNSLLSKISLLYKTTAADPSDAIENKQDEAVESEVQEETETEDENVEAKAKAALKAKLKPELQEMTTTVDEDIEACDCYTCMFSKGMEFSKAKNEKIKQQDDDKASYGAHLPNTQTEDARQATGIYLHENPDKRKDWIRWKAELEGRRRWPDTVLNSDYDKPFCPTYIMK